MKEVLKVLKDELINILEFNYSLGEYDKPKVQYPYIIGEYIEDLKKNEDNSKSGQIILSIFTRGKRIEIENIADILEEHFKFFWKEKNNCMISIEYDHRQMVSSNDETIKKIEVYLKYQKWKGE